MAPGIRCHANCPGSASYTGSPCAQILHNIGKERLELVNSMAPYMTAKVLPILKDTTTCWQPADYLPKPESETFLDEVCAALSARPSAVVVCALHCHQHCVSAAEATRGGLSAACSLARGSRAVYPGNCARPSWHTL